MYNKHFLSPQSGRPKGLVQTSGSPWRQWRLALFSFMLTLLLGVSTNVCADDQGIHTRTDDEYSSFTLSKDKHYIEFYLYLGEECGSESYWTDDPVFYLDGVRIASFSDLKIPIYDKKKGYTPIHDVYSIRDEDELYSYYKPNSFISIGTWDPRYEKSSDNEYWITIGMVIGWNAEGGKHKIELKGTWCNNGGTPYSTTKTFTMNANSIGTFPSTGPTFTRTNGKLNYSVSGLGESTNYSYNIAAYKTSDRVNSGNFDTNVSSVGTGENTYGSWMIRRGASTTGSGSATIGNWEAVTVYPRIYNYYDAMSSISSIIPSYKQRDTTTYKYTGYPKTYWSSLSAYYWWYKDYSAVTLNGYPKAIHVKATTSDRFAKKTRVEWSDTIHDSSHVDKNGKWYIYRTSNDGKQILVGETSYATKYFDDTDDTKEYYDEETVNTTTTYTYTVCFVPNGWVVEAPSDVADLSGTSDTYKLERSFSFSNFKATPTRSSIPLKWSFSSITNAASTKPSIYLQRSIDGGVTWTDIYTQEVTSSSKTDGNYTDQSGSDVTLESETTYSYRLRISSQDRDYYSDILSTMLDGSTKITDFTATRGTLTGIVKLRWTVDQVGSGTTRFNVYRRLMGSTSDKDWENVHTVSGTNAEYSYDDNAVSAGSYYQYKVQLTTAKGSTAATSTDGFCLATGVISGRIYYDAGTAVEGVKVSLTSGTDKNSDGLYSLELAGDHSGLLIDADADVLSKLYDGANSIQMWVKPNSEKMNLDGHDYLLCHTDSTFEVTLTKVAGENKYKLNVWSNGTVCSLSKAIYLTGDVWTHLTIGDDAKDLKVTCITADETSTTATSAGNHSHVGASGVADIYIGNKNSNGTSFASVLSNASDTTHPFQGQVDEFRFWTKSLTDDEIQDNYWHSLAGTEEGLSIYLPMDENIKGQSMAYDISKTNGKSNAHHAQMNVAASSIADHSSLLSRSALTDKNGNYMINGIPFSGEGTNYTITPTLGIHSFNPSNSSRFVSSSSLVYSGVDYKDESSFPVKGIVYYQNTTIPVEGATLYVDGTVASRNNEMVQTDADGKYEIDVPIGDHYIEVKMNGHSFADNGRYPADPTGAITTHTFEGAVSDLTFYDVTTVTVAGRVAGGDDEYEKPLGFGLSKANIGKARLALSYVGSDKYSINVEKQVIAGTNVYSYEPSTTERTYETVTGLSKAYTAAKGNTIIIETDSLTGEFAVKLPPLTYNVTSSTIPSQPAIVNLDTPQIDASNASKEYTDSTEVEKGKHSYFKYCASAKIEYKASSQLDVIENEDGSFGMETVKVKDLSGQTKTVKLYTVADDGTVNYTFGHPVYEELDKRTYKIKAYEKYYNYDTDSKNPVETIVPLAGTAVTIMNQYSTAAVVAIKTSEFVESQSKSISFELDSIGEAKYQFTVGLPNVQGDYTRGITIVYGDKIKWSGNDTFKAIVLGSLTKGNDFVTAGPDQVLYILRDPCGSASNATWSKGFTSTTEKSVEVEVSSDTEITTVTKFGSDIKTVEGIGFAAINDVESTNDVTIGTEITAVFNNNRSYGESITNTRDLSTSDASDYVGSVGDIFYGVSKNRVFGACTQLQIVRDESVADATAANAYKLEASDALSMGEEFSTNFAYTLNHIENVLKPNFIELRNALLTTVADVNSVAAPAVGEDPIYVTTLSADDERFGTSNDDKSAWGDQATEGKTEEVNGRYVVTGPSYTMVLPKDYYCRVIQDQVNYYNNQVSLWNQHLAANEKAKVDAINNRDTYLNKNYSFDAGSMVTETVTSTKDTTRVNTESEDVKLVVGDDMGLSINHTGVLVTLKETIDQKSEYTQTHTGNETTTNSFTLKEDGDDDYLSVDVLKAPDSYGPIFYTRGGATSAPYEDEVVTQYYQPGTVISQKTLQIEKPELEIVDQNVTGVPAGHEATVRIKLRNNSETGEDCYYGLWINPDSNPNGLKITMDGQPITTGINILVTAGQEMTKTLVVSQSDPSILDYEDISLSFYSTSQSDDTGIFPGIYDDDTFSVHFQPASSDVTLTASTAVYNSKTDGDLKLYMSGYDYNMDMFESLRVQYKGENDANFSTLKTYVKDAAKQAADPNLGLLVPLTGTDKLTYSVDLEDSKYLDQTYIFRAQAVGTLNGKEVTTESEEVKVVRDVTLPQLISTPTPTSGVLRSGDDISATFNEDINNAAITNTANFSVYGALNETEVAHTVALSLADGAKAKTLTTIPLRNTSFSVSGWVNYSKDGQLLMHGTETNNFTIATEDGKVAVTMAGKKVTSTKALPKDKWVYINVSYDGTDSLLNVGYAQDASSVNLIKDAQMPNYSSNGNITLGGITMVAKVQELALWNSARTLTDALGDKDITKSRYTNGIIGYWKFNEGHGTLATDNSRSRNMEVSSNAWWIDGTNYAAVLSGSNALKASIGSISTSDSESYLVEAWFRADKTQTTPAAIMSMGNSTLGLQIAKDGNLEFVANGDTTAVTTASVRDDAWHHVALNVLKSTNGSAVVYLDGSSVKQFSASAVPALQGDALFFGCHRNYGGSLAATTYDSFLKGNIDEVRIWKGRRTADVIKANMYNRVEDDADGLVAYYPLEKSSLDQYNQEVTGFNLNDRTANSSDMAMIGTTGTAVTPASTDYSSSITPALTKAPILANTNFSFVTSDRQVKINLDEEPYKLEGCNVFITLKKVKDLHGNESEAVTWCVYVQQNNLKWTDSEISVEKEGANDVTFTAEIENQSGTSEPYTVSGLPSWMTVNSDGGTLSALGKKTLTFTVAASAPIGQYETTVYVTGSQNIPTPLVVSVNSKGDVPEWAVNPAGYEFSMNVAGQLNVDGMNSQDENDIVAAFRGTECVGVAKPTYMQSYDAYFVMMNVYGNSGDEGAALTYKVYDASTDKIYPNVDVTLTKALTFNADKVVGDLTTPNVWSTTDKIEQSFDLAKGWQWISFYVNPTKTNASELLADVKSMANKLISEKHSWTSVSNSISDITGGVAYKLQMKQATPFNVVGTAVDLASAPLNIKANAWSWIGYPASGYISLAEAFAELEPANSDVIKSQTAFSMWNGSEWIGTLKTMQSGVGYLYQSKASADRSFHYPAVSSSSSAAKAAVFDDDELSDMSLNTAEADSIVRNYRGNMSVVAIVVKDGMAQPAQLSVVDAEGNVRGISDTEVEGMHFLTVSGNENGDELTVVATVNGYDYNIPGTLVYNEDTVVGSLAKPMVIDLDSVTGIGTVDGDQSDDANGYDLSGRRIQKNVKNQVIITDGKKIVK